MCVATGTRPIPRHRGSVGENGTNPDEQDPSSPGAVAPKQGWDRVEELLTRTTDVLVTAPSPEVLAELATKWCEVEPIPRQTEHGEVRVCYLYPPVRVKGVALTLELSANGIVGFVAPELDAIKSQGNRHGSPSNAGTPVRAPVGRCLHRPRPSDLYRRRRLRHLP